METTDWWPCIVTMSDLIGTRRDAASGEASSAMPGYGQAVALLEDLTGLGIGG